MPVGPHVKPQAWALGSSWDTGLSYSVPTCLPPGSLRGLEKKHSRGSWRVNAGLSLLARRKEVACSVPVPQPRSSVTWPRRWCIVPNASSCRAPPTHAGCRPIAEPPALCASTLPRLPLLLWAASWAWETGPASRPAICQRPLLFPEGTPHDTPAPSLRTLFPRGLEVHSWRRAQPSGPREPLPGGAGVRGLRSLCVLSCNLCFTVFVHFKGQQPRTAPACPTQGGLPVEAPPGGSGLGTSLIKRNTPAWPRPRPRRGRRAERHSRCRSLRTQGLSDEGSEFSHVTVCIFHCETSTQKTRETEKMPIIPQSKQSPGDTWASL